jgi:hypothetical protein
MNAARLNRNLIASVIGGADTIGWTGSILRLK